MDRLISEQAVLDVINRYGTDELRIKAIKAIPSAEPQDSEDKIIRRTLENFMRGLWEEIQVGELEYTTSEVYEMLEREIFTDNHVTIPSAEPTYYPPCEDCHKKMDEIRNAYDKMMDEIRKTHDKMLSLDDDCISRSKTVADIKEFFRMGDCYCDEYSIVGCINGQPSVAIRR